MLGGQESSILELPGTLRGFRWTMEAMWADISGLNLIEQVPALQRNFLEGSRGFSLVEGQERLAPAQRSVQRPRLFYRRDPDPNPLLVVAPPAQPK